MGRRGYGISFVLAVFCLGTVSGSHGEEPLPLTVEATYGGLSAGTYMEVSRETFPQTSMGAGGAVPAVMRRSDQGALKAVPQWRSQSGSTFFALQSDLAEGARDCYWVSRVPRGELTALADGFLESSLPVGGTWRVAQIRASRLSVGKASPGGVRLSYHGKDTFSRHLAESPGLPVKGGCLVQFVSRTRMLRAPEVTEASLPGMLSDGLRPSPHQIENQLTGFVYTIRFYDVQGKRLSGPDLWELRRLVSAYPLERRAVVMAPAGAARVTLCCEFQGKGDVELLVEAVSALSFPADAILGEGNCGVEGKVTFPQWEQALGGKAWKVSLPLKVDMTQAARALDIQREVLLDGLRRYDVEVVPRGWVHAGLPGDYSQVCRDHAERLQALPAEGYFLKIQDGEIWVLGKDARGLFYGFQELGERLALGMGRLENAVMVDYPAMELRIVHQLLNWGHVKDPEGYYGKWLPELARHRINCFAFDERRDWFRLGDPEVARYWKRLGDLCRKWQIMPIPMGMSFRNLQPVQEGMEWAAAKWTQDEPVVLNGVKETELRGHEDGYYVRSGDTNGFGFAPLADGTRPTLAFTRDGNPFVVRSEDGKIVYRRGIDYVVESHYSYSEGYHYYSLPGNALVLHRPTTLRRTAESAIPDGARVLVSYNYLYRQRGHQNEHFATCISEAAAVSRAQEALADMVRAVRPQWIHVNQDEIIGVGRDGRDLVKLKENGGDAGRLFADLLEALKHSARQAGITTPLIAWSDNFTPAHHGWSQNYNGPDYLYGVRRHIRPEDYLIDVWGGVGTAEDLLQRGYSILVAPTEDKGAIVESALYLQDRKLQYGKGRVRGIQLSCWRGPEETRFLHLRDFARLGWNPGPWGRRNAAGKLRFIYDLYDVPLKANGMPLASGDPEESAWGVWRAGWCRRIPESLQDSSLELVNARGYRKRMSR